MRTGRFAFRIGQIGDFLVKVDTKSLPKGAALTTLNRQAASFIATVGKPTTITISVIRMSPTWMTRCWSSLSTGTSKQRIKEILDGYGLKLKRHQDGIDVYLLTTPPGEVDAVIEYLLSELPCRGGVTRSATASSPANMCPGDPDYADPSEELWPPLHPGRDGLG